MESDLNPNPPDSVRDEQAAGRETTPRGEPADAERRAADIISRAEAEAAARRARVVTAARKDVEGLINRAEAMLDRSRVVTRELEDVVDSLRESSARLRAHVEELTGDQPRTAAKRRRLR